MACYQRLGVGSIWSSLDWEWGAFGLTGIGCVVCSGSVTSC